MACSLPCSASSACSAFSSSASRRIRWRCRCWRASWRSRRWPWPASRRTSWRAPRGRSTAPSATARRPRIPTISSAPATGSSAAWSSRSWPSRWWRSAPPRGGGLEQGSGSGSEAGLVVLRSGDSVVRTPHRGAGRIGGRRHGRAAHHHPGGVAHRNRAGQQLRIGSGGRSATGRTLRQCRLGRVAHPEDRAQLPPGRVQWGEVQSSVVGGREPMASLGRHSPLRRASLDGHDSALSLPSSHVADNAS